MAFTDEIFPILAVEEIKKTIVEEINKSIKEYTVVIFYVYTL